MHAEGCAEEIGRCWHVGQGGDARDRHALKQMAAQLAERHDLSKKQTEAVLADLVTLTARHLKKGERLRLSGLGILQVRHRAARMGRNPATGEAIKIKASKKIAFRPAKELKDAI